jgi:hypothetical protein
MVQGNDLVLIEKLCNPFLSTEEALKAARKAKGVRNVDEDTELEFGDSAARQDDRRDHDNRDD